MFTDEQVMNHVGDGVMSIKQAEAFWAKLFDVLYPQEYKIWAVFDKERQTYIGHTGIYPRPTKTEDWEFVYFLNPQSWNKGYATEIAWRIVRFGFEELNLKEVFATVNDNHTASIKILKKAGMQFRNFEKDEEGRYSVYSVSR